MNDKFDELAEDLAQSVTRRQALRHFGLGLAGAVLASIGLATQAEADGAAGKAVQKRRGCKCNKPDFGCRGDLACVEFCGICCAGGCNV